MADTIKYGIYPNPLPDAEGNTTFQVRHEPDGTMDTESFLAHLKYHQTFNPTIMRAALITLVDEIVEQLRDNRRFRIDGLGTFQMKVGFKAKTDDEGNNSVRPVFTDPEAITARDVEVSGISFTPDRSLIDALRKGTAATKASPSGVVGRSVRYTREDIETFLDDYLAGHDFITRRQFRILLGLSDYACRKWLNILTTAAQPKYQACLEGTTIVYRRSNQD